MVSSNVKWHSFSILEVLKQDDSLFFLTNIFVITFLVKKYLFLIVFSTKNFSFIKAVFWWGNIIAGYLTLPSYISCPLISTAELFWHNLPAAEVEGLDFCVNHDPGPGMSGRQSPSPQQAGSKREIQLLSPWICCQCWHNCFSYFAVACIRLSDLWGNKCHSSQDSRSIERKTSAGSDIKSNQAINALQFLPATVTLAIAMWNTTHEHWNLGDCITSVLSP